MVDLLQPKVAGIEFEDVWAAVAAGTGESGGTEASDEHGGVSYQYVDMHRQAATRVAMWS